MTAALPIMRVPVEERVNVTMRVFLLPRTWVGAEVCVVGEEDPVEHSVVHWQITGSGAPREDADDDVVRFGFLRPEPEELEDIADRIDSDIRDVEAVCWWWKRCCLWRGMRRHRG